jgi:hypothetical protein|tara:strand:+ start:1073 stop:1378 length:306 start_codon:yes stop_codon:yes gene_type:complete
MPLTNERLYLNYFGHINLNTAWADTYIYDVWRKEKKSPEDIDDNQLEVMYEIIEAKLQKYTEKVIRLENKFDTYEFFEEIIEDQNLLDLVEETHNTIKDGD